ncbi:MAG TPA: hypothetical protein VN193_14595 [Candidatus Angelobacter sp.]|jgi:hypothetical protein|nr:hypothetical protein [Candidatus Angelobacter sp.]
MRLALVAVVALCVSGCSSGRATGATPSPLAPLSSVAGPSVVAGGDAPSVTPGAPDTGTGAPASAALQVEQDVLANIGQNGWDSAAGLNGGLGQLWINWRTGSTPLSTNWNNVPAAECTVGGGGTPQCTSSPPRTDRLTDLRYLHALALYRNQHPGDTRFDAQFSRWAGIVKSLWGRPRDERGWTYEVLVDITRLTGDGFYAAAAAQQAHYYSATVFHASCGCLYFTDTAHPRGFYRPVDTVEEAAALAEEGARTGNQTYIAQARTALQFLLAHGYLRAWHAFPYAWDQVLNADGSVNSSPVFAAGLPNAGQEVRVIWLAQEAQTLLHATRATGDTRYSTLATELLDAITPAQNTLGLWDSAHGGYCEKATFSGSGLAQPGSPSVGCSKKEAGRQLVVLDAVRVAATVGLGSRYADLQQRMTALAVGPDYYSHGAGYVYEVAPDYSLFLNHSVPEDWVTTEADGIALEALFALSDPSPW